MLRNVHKDVTALLQWTVIEKNDAGLVFVPWNEMDVRWPLTIHHYDPAIPEWSARAQPRRFVAWFDALEPIEPHLIDKLLDDLKTV